MFLTPQLVENIVRLLHILLYEDIQNPGIISIVYVLSIFMLSLYAAIAFSTCAGSLSYQQPLMNHVFADFLLSVLSIALCLTPTKNFI